MPTHAQKTGRGAYWLLLNEPIIHVLACMTAHLVSYLRSRHGAGMAGCAGSRVGFKLYWAGMPVAQMKPGSPRFGSRGGSSPLGLRLLRAVGVAVAPTDPRPRAQSRGPHRSRRQPTPLPGLRCGTRLAHRASPPRRPTPVVRSEGGVGAHPPVPFGLPSPPAAAATGRSCAPFATTRLGARYRLAASSAPSSTSCPRSCSSPGPSSPY
jgi:hypothetical protein